MANVPGDFRLHIRGDGSGGQLFYWVLTTDTGQAIATSGKFSDRPTAERAIQWVKDNVAKCPTLDPPDLSKGAR